VPEVSRACSFVLPRNDPMGAGTSAPLFVELQKPLDASDLENFEDARNEVVHLRRLLAKAAVRLFCQNFLAMLFFLRLSCDDKTRQSTRQPQDKTREGQDKDKARTRQGQDKTRHTAREDNNSLTKMPFICF
jgi:hypothetical protein